MKKPISFLIVDDNSVMRRTIRYIVGEFSDEIIECENGSEAFSVYRQRQPDWVLMDIEMAGTDGLTATREICAAFPQAQILIVTKYDDAAMRQAAEDAGACGYILKENLLELREFINAEI